MRSFTAALLGLAVALPLGVATVPAHADQDGYGQQYQTPNWRGDNAWRSRQNEWRNDHAQRDRDHHDYQAERGHWRNDNGWRRDNGWGRGENWGYQPREGEHHWAENGDGDHQGVAGDQWRHNDNVHGDQGRWKSDSGD